MAGARTTIDIDDDLDRWAWRCPRGHARWVPRRTHWWCHRCASEVHANETGAFEELRSARTGETVRREEVLVRSGDRRRSTSPGGRG